MIDELYNTNPSNVKFDYNSDSGDDTDPHKHFFREFDYGIDLTDNVIVICDEIQMGVLPEFIAKVRLLKKVNTESILIFEGIHERKEIESSWEKIKMHKEVKLTIDLYKLGIVFFRQEQLEKENFTIRF